MFSTLPTKYCFHRTLTLTSTSIVIPHRGFSHSRFPREKEPGTARKILRSPPRNSISPTSSSDRLPPIEFEDRPSIKESQLWKEGQRKLARSPQEGLSKLLFENDTLVITRQLEMLNVFMGFEQTNRYAITNEDGEPLGYIAEEPRGLLSIFTRQIFRTHRPFRALIMDLKGSPVLWVRRPFAWINSRMFVQRLKEAQEYRSEDEPVLDTFAEVQQRWHLWRRQYDLFIRESTKRILSVASEPQPEPESDQFKQLARVDEGLLAWHFTLLDARGEAIATVNRAFRGFGREIFTDTGQYFVNFGAGASENNGPAPHVPSVIRNLTLEERALVLAMSVNIDFDYFSRHSEAGHGLGWGMWGGGWDSE